MISWQLWRAIGTPPREHPLFRHWLANAVPAGHRATSAFIGWAFACSGLTFCSLIVFEWIPYMVLVALFALNTLDGTRWAWRISQAIVTEKAQNRYELLAALPGGKLAVCWAIATGRLYESKSFRFTLYTVKVMTGIMLITLIGVIAFSAVVVNLDTDSVERLAANEGVLLWGIIAVPFAIAFFIDHRYSLVTGVIFGLVAQIDLKNGAEASIRAILGFMCLQMGVYLFAYVTLVLWLPQLIVGTLIPQSLLMLSLLGLTLYVALREMILRSLWRYAVRQLDADRSDVKMALFGLPS